MPDLITNNPYINTVCTDTDCTIKYDNVPNTVWASIPSTNPLGEWKIDLSNVKWKWLIKEVKIITNEEDVAIGVKITFDGGSVQKAICSEDDVFNLEYGITICLVKQLLKVLGSANASRDYNNAVRDVLKQYEKQELAELEEEEKKAQIEYRRAKRAEKKRRRAERKAAAERERQIEIQKEAYLRAMQEYDRQRIDRMTDDLK